MITVERWGTGYPAYSRIFVTRDFYKEQNVPVWSGTVPAGGTEYTTPINVSRYTKFAIYVFGITSDNPVQVKVEASPDSLNWAPVFDYGTLSSDLVITPSELGDAYFSYVRLVLTNTGTSDVTITVKLDGAVV